MEDNDMAERVQGWTRLCIGAIERLARLSERGGEPYEVSCARAKLKRYWAKAVFACEDAQTRNVERGVLLSQKFINVVDDKVQFVLVMYPDMDPVDVAQIETLAEDAKAELLIP